MRVAVWIATVCGAGYSPVAPGTAGSAVALVVLWALPFSRAGLLAFLVVVVVVGTWAAHVAEGAMAEKDPGAIVIDEVAGMTVTLAALPLPFSVPVLLAGFLLFRIFDVVKPFPAGRLQAVPGGVGVMIDDLIAGLYALAILVVARAATGWPP